MHPAFGVAFRCVFAGRADEATLDRFIDFVESKGWQYGGPWTPTGMSGVVEFDVDQRDIADRCKADLLDWFDGPSGSRPRLFAG